MPMIPRDGMVEPRPRAPRLRRQATQRVCCYGLASLLGLVLIESLGLYTLLIIFVKVIPHPV